MNNQTSLIWNVILTIAVVALFFLHFSKNSTGDASGETSLEGKRVVYVQVDSLLKNYAFFEDTRKELENKRFQLENDLTTRGRSLENEIAFFQQRAQTMTLDQARNTEAQLARKQQELVAYRDRSVQTLSQQEADKNEELYNRIRNYIKKYNKENNFEYVLGYTNGGGILFADSTLNVTQKILDGLNKEYKSLSDKGAKADSTAKK